MDIKKIQQASKWLERVAILDSEIKEITDMAIFIASNPSEIMFSLKVLDVNPTGKVLDEDGSLQKQENYAPGRMSIMEMFLGNVGQRPSQKPKFKFDINKVIPDTLTLELLGVLLENKHKERDTLIDKIEKL